LTHKKIVTQVLPFQAPGLSCIVHTLNEHWKDLLKEIRQVIIRWFLQCEVDSWFSCAFLWRAPGVFGKFKSRSYFKNSGTSIWFFV